MSVMATDLALNQAGMMPSASAPRIHQMLCAPVTPKVATVAMTMPQPAWTMPLRAVTGEDMRLMPRMNRTAATK